MTLLWETSVLFKMWLKTYCPLHTIHMDSLQLFHLHGMIISGCNTPVPGPPQDFHPNPRGRQFLLRHHPPGTSISSAVTTRPCTPGSPPTSRDGCTNTTTQGRERATPGAAAPQNSCTARPSPHALQHSNANTNFAASPPAKRQG